MKTKIGILGLVLTAILTVGLIPNSMGHGLGTETMPPVMIGGTEATLEVGSSTMLDTGIRQITIKLFETSSGDSIKNSTFEVELVKGEDSLFTNNFERDDGILIMNLVPSEKPNVEIINQETFASIFGLASDQFNVQGKVFENGGLYKFSVKIITIESFDNILSQPVEYNLGISIPETTYYKIDGGEFGMQEIGIRTYFDQINEFNYIVDKQEVQFSFPFDWEQETIDQSSVVHEEILIPKTFGALLVSDFSATLNGIELDTDTITIDDFNSDERIVHIVVSQSELQEIFDNNDFDVNEISIHVKPSELNLPLTGITENGQFKINLLSGFSNISPNSTALLEFEILDVFLKDKPMQVSYELKILHQNNEIFSKSGTSSGVKSDPEKLEFFVPTDISGVIELQFEGLGDSDYARLGFPVAIQSSLSTIPDWVKNTAGWWANGEIPDSAFVNGIQYLIKEGIIVIPETEQGSSTSTLIPDWVKNTAGWWANGEIPDSAFVNGIQYLIKEGIIVLS